MDKIIGFFSQYYSPLTIQMESKQNKNTDNLFKDPLHFLLIFFGGTIMYMFFANEIILYLVGLVYPAYSMFQIVSALNNHRSKRKNTNDKSIALKGNYAEKSISLMKYLVIYSHVEIAGKFIGFSVLPVFYHLKMIWLILLIYLSEYKYEWLDQVYQKVIFYDKVAYNIIYSIIEWIKSEAKKVEKKNSK